jgi:hypothetical protein
MQQLNCKQDTPDLLTIIQYPFSINPSSTPRTGMYVYEYIHTHIHIYVYMGIHMCIY